MESQVKDSKGDNIVLQLHTDLKVTLSHSAEHKVLSPALVPCSRDEKLPVLGMAGHAWAHPEQNGRPRSLGGRGLRGDTVQSVCEQGGYSSHSSAGAATWTPGLEAVPRPWGKAQELPAHAASAFHLSPSNSAVGPGGWGPWCYDSGCSSCPWVLLLSSPCPAPGVLTVIGSPCLLGIHPVTESTHPLQCSGSSCLLLIAAGRSASTARVSSFYSGLTFSTWQGMASLSSDSLIQVHHLR